MYSGPKRNSDGKSSELVLSPSGIPSVLSAPGVGLLLYLQMVSSRCLLGPRGDRGAPRCRCFKLLSPQGCGRRAPLTRDPWECPSGEQRPQGTLAGQRAGETQLCALSRCQSPLLLEHQASGPLECDGAREREDTVEASRHPGNTDPAPPSPFTGSFTLSRLVSAIPPCARWLLGTPRSSGLCP